MKSFVIALLLLCLMLAGIIFNSLYINNVVNGIEERLDVLPDIGEEGCQEQTAGTPARVGSTGRMGQSVRQLSRIRSRQRTGLAPPCRRGLRGCVRLPCRDCPALRRRRRYAAAGNLEGIRLILE